MVFPSITVVFGVFQFCSPWCLAFFCLSHLSFPALSFTNLNFNNGQHHINDTTSSCLTGMATWVDIASSFHGFVRVETAKRVLGEFANMYPSQLFKEPTRQKCRLGVETHWGADCCCQKTSIMASSKNDRGCGNVSTVFPYQYCWRMEYWWQVDREGRHVAVKTEQAPTAGFTRVGIRSSGSTKCDSGAFPQGCAHTNQLDTGPTLEKI